MARKKTAKDRIRATIRARLDAIGMTARELAKDVRRDVTDREVDAWISGILKGTQGLSWKYFDAVADKLGIAPSDLVRYDDSDLRELTPREMRLLRHFREWPGDIQLQWLALLDHFAATIPDKDTARLLDHLRATPRRLRRPVLTWLIRLLEEGTPPELLTGDGADGSSGAPTGPNTTRPGRKDRREAADHEHAVDRETPQRG